MQSYYARPWSHDAIKFLASPVDHLSTYRPPRPYIESLSTYRLVQMISTTLNNSM
jgi:hypothetical protein